MITSVLPQTTQNIHLLSIQTQKLTCVTVLQTSISTHHCLSPRRLKHTVTQSMLDWKVRNSLWVKPAVSSSKTLPDRAEYNSGLELCPREIAWQYQSTCVSKFSLCSDSFFLFSSLSLPNSDSSLCMRWIMLLSLPGATLSVSYIFKKIKDGFCRCSHCFQFLL